MITLLYLATLYAESRLQYEWHDDQCACGDFPEACSTYNQSEYFWRRNTPMGWNAEAVTEKVIEFMELTVDAKGRERAILDFETAAMERAKNSESVDDDLLIFYVYPVR